MKASYLDGRKIIVNDQVYLYLFGTSYLGLPYNPDFQRYLSEGFLKYGSSLGSSPVSIPPLAVYAELEDLLAAKFGCDDALLFPSGYAAGQAVVNLYHQQDHKIQYGNIAHPALKLESKIKAANRDAENSGNKLHAVDFIDPITFEKYDLSTVDQQKDKVLIDVSHGLGLFDEEVRSLSKLPNIALCGSLNKALGINAGVLLCSTSIKQQLQQSLRYKTASAPSPAECYALQQAFNTGLVKDQQVHLKKMIENFKSNSAYNCRDNFPVLKLQNGSEELSDNLKQNEILIWRNRYPAVDSPMVNRVVFTAAHKEEDVELFFEQLDKLV